MHVILVNTTVRSKDDSQSMLFDIGNLDGELIHVVSQDINTPPAPNYPPIWS